MNTDGIVSKQQIIRKRLFNGETPQQLIADGFARSTVYQVNKQLTRDPLISSEIGELREKKAKLKLEADIEEMESKREKVPLRIERLEKQLSALADKLDRMSANLLYALQYASLYTLHNYNLIEKEPKDLMSKKTYEGSNKFGEELDHTFSETIKKV
jgi:predicted nuclease with TOPRIM domain